MALGLDAEIVRYLERIAVAHPAQQVSLEELYGHVRFARGRETDKDQLRHTLGDLRHQGFVEVQGSRYRIAHGADYRARCWLAEQGHDAPWEFEAGNAGSCAHALVLLAILALVVVLMWAVCFHG